MGFWSRRYTIQYPPNELLNDVEQVYIVWSGGKQTPRFKTPAYRICSFVLLGYVTVLVLMIMGKNSFIRGDGMCMIGLKDFAYVQITHVSWCISHAATGRFPQ